jgi:hypothetical protein
MRQMDAATQLEEESQAECLVREEVEYGTSEASQEGNAIDTHVG